MTVRKTILVVVIILFPYLLPAQNTAKITGRIIDAETQKPLPSATVVLMQASDSSRTTGIKSDKDGKFTIETKIGDYMLEAKYVGYKTQLLKNIHISNTKQNIEIGDIALQLEVMQTDAVTITAEKEPVVFDGDRKIFNITEDLVTAGGNATDVLKNIPSVAVDNDGKVSMRGEGVKVLIDGKESNLSSDIALKSIPSELIESVELITNPSAKYAAEGITGIIDIKLKKDKGDGLNAFISLWGGADFEFKRNENGGASFDGNYKTGNLNIFGNASIGFYGNKNTSEYFSKTWTDGADTNFINKDYNYKYDGLWDNFKLGVDYDITPNDLLTVYASYSGGYYDNNNSAYSVVRNNLDTTQKYYADGTSDRPYGYFQPTINYKHKFDTSEHTLWVDMYYNRKLPLPYNVNQSLTYFPIPPMTDISVTQDKANAESSADIFVTQIDYEYFLTKIGKLEAGLKFQARNIKYIEDYNSLIDNVWTYNEGRSNNMQIGEKISAGYFMFGSNIGDFKYKLGLRAENTDYNYHENMMDTAFSNNYWSLIPTVHLSYKLSLAHSFSLSYSRRLDRPSYESLTPRISWSLDSTTAYSGNPDLEPSYYNSYEASYLLFTPKTTLSTSIFYRNTNNAWENYSTVLDNGALLSTPQNIAKRASYGIDGNIMQTIADWWKLNLNLGYYKTVYEAPQLNVAKKEQNSWNMNIRSYFSVSKQLNFQLTGYYSPATIDVQGENPAYYDMSFGGQYSMFDDNFSVYMGAYNLLGNRNAKGTSSGSNFYSEMVSHWSYPGFYVGINYKINNYQQKQRRGESSTKTGQPQGDGGTGGL